LKQGVALIDFGAGTTTVTVYKGGKLRFLAVIPLGGENMTHDIHAHDGMDEDEAEELKKEAGDILYEPKENISGEEAAAVKKLNEIIGARAEEIVANVKQMLTEAKAERMQLVLTGGGANLRNIDAMVASLTGATKVRITTKSCIPTEDPKYLLPTEHNVYALIGTLATGKENCVETMAKQTSGAVKTSDDLFGYESTESKKPIKSDREKKQKDEEERTRIKEENRKKKEEEKAAKKAAQGPGFFDKAWKGLKNTIENIADDLA
jgi:cell division protein FtsA